MLGTAAQRLHSLFVIAEAITIEVTTDGSFQRPGVAIWCHYCAPRISLSADKATLAGIDTAPQVEKRP